MSFLLSNRALFRGILAGAVVLAGTACSRSDRAESGRDNSAAALPDTTSAQPSGGGATGAVSDTAPTSGRSDSLAQPSTSAQSSPRAETAPAGDKDAAGYRPMERDTTSVSSQQADSALPDTSISAIPEGADTAAIDASADAADTTSTEMAGAADTATRVDVNVDTAAMGADTAAVEMARDTSTVVDQADTAAVPSSDVALQTTVDTSSKDSAEVSAEAEVAVVTTDSTAGAGSPDSTEIVGVRPPEDSTELLGNVSPDEAADETADEQIVRPEDRETVAASEAPTDEVGAAAVSGDVTGADAVALMTREGVRCGLVDPEANEAVRWDMSSTPVTLNPCGMGSMVLSRIWTEGSTGQE